MFQRRKEQSNVDQQLPAKSSSKPTSPSRTADKQLRGASDKVPERQLSPTHSTKSSTASSNDELTWDEAHRRTCLDKKSLAVSFDQVTESFSSFRQFPNRREDFVIWNEGASSEAAASLNRKINDSPKPIAKLESKPERPSSWARRILSSLTIGADDDDDAHLNFGDDDGEQPGPNADEVVVQPDELIVNVELAQQCLKELQLALCDQPNRVLLRNSSESNIQPDVAHRFSFETWCQQVAAQGRNKEAQVLLANAHHPMSDFLGALLVANNLATLAPNRDDRIILGNASALPSTEIGTMVTLFDLQINEESMKKNVENWSARADACGRSALEARRKGRTRQAAMDLQRRKTILQQVEATSNSLLQIEQIRNTVEHAQTQTETIECLQSTADALKNMRADPTALQSLHLDIDSNKAALDQSALHSSFAGTSEENEALLQELEQMDEEQLLLELNDLQVTSPVATGQTGRSHMVGVTTGVSSYPTSAVKPSHALLDATIGIAPSKQASPKKSSGQVGTTKKNDEEIIDPEVRELERRLEALRVPVSSNKKTAKDKKTADKPLAAAAVF